MKILCMNKLEIKTRTEFYINVLAEKNTHKLNIRSRCKAP